jgi:hypothetical protein
MKKIIVSLFTLVSLVSFVFPTTSFASTTIQQFNQATASWVFVSGAKCYNIYYGKTNKPQTWNYSVRCVPNTMWKYWIKDLQQGVSYSYTVAALNYSGKEISWTPVKPLVTSPMP